MFEFLHAYPDRHAHKRRLSGFRGTPRLELHIVLLSISFTILPVSAVATRSKALQSSVFGSECRGSWILHDMECSFSHASFPNFSELTCLVLPQQGSSHPCQVQHPVKPWPSVASQARKYVFVVERGWASRSCIWAKSLLFNRSRVAASVPHSSLVKRSSSRSTALGRDFRSLSWNAVDEEILSEGN